MAARTLISDPHAFEFSLPESMKRKCEWCGEIGAPLNEAFAEEIGADGYCRDAAMAVEMAIKVMESRQGSAAATKLNNAG